MQISQDNDLWPIGVVGAGSWGTALAHLLAQKGHDVDLWAYEPEVCKQIETAVSNSHHLILCGLIQPRHKYIAECDIPITTAVTLSWQSTPSILLD